MCHKRPRSAVKKLLAYTAATGAMLATLLGFLWDRRICFLLFVFHKWAGHTFQI